MRLCSIASGSSGNCVYVASDSTHLLVDVGISGRRTEQGLNSLGVAIRDVDGILITHEHSDHIAGLPILAKKYQIPIYATAGTIEAIRRATDKSKNKEKTLIDPELFVEIAEDERFTIKDLTIHPMRISHDAAQPVGYRISYGNRRVAVCTDLGFYNDYTVESLRGMNAILLEANHDVNMLQVGPYPYYLKQRILGNRGHLSNENSGKLLGEILHDGMQGIVLGHLSKENNLPELAYEAVRMEINLGDNPYKASDFPIQVARRDEVSPVMEVV